MMAQRSRDATPVDGSRTLVESRLESEQHPEGSSERIVGSLRLRGAHSNRPRVKWDEDVVDNEGMGKKKSKICCIYHKPKQFDESSDESSDEDEDSDPDVSGARPSHAFSSRRHRHHNHDGECDHTHRPAGSDDDRNTYETVPGRWKGKGKP